MPSDYDGGSGWNSKKRDLRKLIPHAKAAVEAVIRGEVRDLARQRARFLTLGVHLNVERHKEQRREDDHRWRRTCPPTCTHAELVAVLDTSSGTVVRWTGKSYPADSKQHSQQHTLIHAKDLRSHLLDIGSERLLVLGYHDLLMFIDRGRKSSYGRTPKETRRHRMRKIARQFEPTIVLHHPHSTYSPRVWNSAWGATRSVLPTTRVWASGIAYCGNPDSWKPWQTVDATRPATASQADVFDVIINGCGG